MNLTPEACAAAVPNSVMSLFPGDHACSLGLHLGHCLSLGDIRVTCRLLARALLCLNDAAGQVKKGHTDSSGSLQWDVRRLSRHGDGRGDC